MHSPDPKTIRVVATELLRQAGFQGVFWDGEPSWASRNTLILHGRADRLPVLAKMSRNSVGNVAEGEITTYRQLAEQLLEHPMFAVPIAIAADPEYGIVVTEYIEGESIDMAILKTAMSIIKQRQPTGELLALAQKFGSALRWFHESGNRHGDRLERTRLYLDFSPRNMLLRTADNRVVFIDPPPNEVIGRVECDLGIALFELSRVLLRMPHARAIRLWLEIRRAFLEGYGANNISAVQRHGLVIIYREERRHLWRVMGRYLTFWRFPDWRRQAARAIVIVPGLLLLYIGLISFYQRRQA